MARARASSLFAENCSLRSWPAVACPATRRTEGKRRIRRGGGPQEIFAVSASDESTSAETGLELRRWCCFALKIIFPIKAPILVFSNKMAFATAPIEIYCDRSDTGRIAPGFRFGR